jgi:hypothetical protein
VIVAKCPVTLTLPLLSNNSCPSPNSYFISKQVVIAAPVGSSQYKIQTAGKNTINLNCTSYLLNSHSSVTFKSAGNTWISL